MTGEPEPEGVDDDEPDTAGDESEEQQAVPPLGAPGVRTGEGYRPSPRRGPHPRHGPRGC
jgi:hypothetical protein